MVDEFEPAGLFWTTSGRRRDRTPPARHPIAACRQVFAGPAVREPGAPLRGSRTCPPAHSMLLVRVQITLAKLHDLGEDGVEALALDVLHGIVMHILVLADPEDRNDVGVMQQGRGLRLAFELRRWIGPNWRW